MARLFPTMGNPRFRVYWGDRSAGVDVSRDTFIEQLTQLSQSDFQDAPARRLTIEALDDEDVYWRGFYKDRAGLEALLEQMRQERDIEEEARYLAGEA